MRSTSSSSSTGSSFTATPLGRTQTSRASILTKILQYELDHLYAIQRMRRFLPGWLRRLVDGIISPHPAYDFSFVVWLGIMCAIPFVGWPLTWIAVGNIILSFLLSWVVGPHAKAPAELDPRLKPRGRVSPEPFPCVEMHLASVLVIMVISQYPSNLSVVLSLSLGFLLLLWLRLYAVTHFFHQLLGSILLGALSIPSFYFLGRTAFPKGITATSQTISAVCVGALFLAYVSYKIENNDAPILRIPREQYLQVLRDLVEKGEGRTGREVDALTEEEQQQLLLLGSRGQQQAAGAGGQALQRGVGAGMGSLLQQAELQRAGQTRYPPAGPARMSRAAAAAAGGGQAAAAAAATEALAEASRSAAAGNNKPVRDSLYHLFEDVEQVEKERRRKASEQVRQAMDTVQAGARR